MVEKIITLENVSLVEFLGPDNQNIRQLAAAFPGSKIISRGNEIKIQGQTPVIARINEILSSLIEHYHQYGAITDRNVSEYIAAADDEQQERIIATASPADVGHCPDRPRRCRHSSSRSTTWPTTVPLAAGPDAGW